MAGLVATFLTPGEDVTGDFARRHLPPFDVEAAAVAKQRSPEAIVDVHGDSEALRVVVVPLPHIGYAAEEHGKIEPDHAFVESLRTRKQPETASLVNRQVDVNGQMLMRAEVVDNPSASVAVDHVRVEATCAA